MGVHFKGSGFYITDSRGKMGSGGTEPRHPHAQHRDQSRTRNPTSLPSLLPEERHGSRERLCRGRRTEDRHHSPGPPPCSFWNSGAASTPAEDDPIVIASINGRRTSLAEPLFGDERIRFIRMNDTEAQTTIQRTVQFLALAAAEELFPGAHPATPISAAARGCTANWTGPSP